jgi:hypothetical protein
MLFGGEGVFLATLTGPGKVWLQSLPFSRMAVACWRRRRRVAGRTAAKVRCSVDSAAFSTATTASEFPVPPLIARLQREFEVVNSRLQSTSSR